MYPLIIIWDIKIYTFWVFLLISWILFFACLHFFAQQKSIIKPIFSDIFSFTISILFFGRLFYFLSDWRNSKFMFQEFFASTAGFSQFLHDFFLSNNYNLSLAGGIIGFTLVFLYKLHKHKASFKKQLDILLPSFLIAGIVGYIGAFLGGQVYGIPSTAFWAIDYNTKYSTIPGQLFPLAPLYVLVFSLLLSVWFWLSKKQNIVDGYIGFILLGILGIFLFFAEFLSGAPDMFEIFIRINQLTGLVFIGISFVWIIKFLRS